MPYNVLFPFKNESDLKDFAATGNAERGWIETDPNDEKILDKMAKNMSGSGADLDDRDSAIMSIPSPIAYVLDFIKQLKDNKPNAVKEWRGLLAAIALQKLLNGIEIGISEYTIQAGDGTDGKFRKIVGDALRENASITGYGGAYAKANKVDLSKLYVFSNDSKPFAIYLPSIIICPFKDYDRKIFENLPWLEDGEWKDVLTCGELDCRSAVKDLSERNDTLKKLYYWLDGFSNDTNFKKSPYKELIDNFRDKIYKHTTTTGKPTPNDGELKDWENANDKKIYGALKKICAGFDWEPQKCFSDKLLLFTAPEGAEFRHDEKEKFVPREIKVDQVSRIYVIPPISIDVIDSLKKGAQIATGNDDGWNVVYNKSEKTFTAKCTLRSQDGKNSRTYTNIYRANRDVYWMSDLPYISMWPYVKFTNDIWKDYLVSVFMRRDETSSTTWTNNDIGSSRNAGISLCEFSKSQLVGEMDDERNGIPAVEISVVADDITSKDCVSQCIIGFASRNDKKLVSNQKFKMIKSKSAPYAISFACGKESLGHWILDWKAPVEIVGGKKGVIGMDFGTTSTNVYMKIGQDDPKSISSPNSYVHDIFKPCSQQEKNLFQRYYLFGAEDADQKLGKIFTYGQNFGRDNTVNLSVDPNLTGRFLKVDNEYIIADTGKDNGIFNNLKWSSDGDDNYTYARKNFVNSLLNFALLEARANGVADIEVRLSYPAPNLGNSVQQSIELGCLRENSGGFNIKGATEAQCAGMYCEHHYGISINRQPAIDPMAGYAIVDIGGGTTDVSFMKADNPNENATMHAEHSFKVAGINIIEKTFIDFFENRSADFKNIWTTTGSNDTLVSKAVEKFCKIKRPAAGNNEKYYQDKGEILNFLMENSEVQEGCYGNENYNKLFQAIRMKYYILFWLIANFIRHDEKIEIDPSTINICLAGCGSKGYNMCLKSGNSIGVNMGSNVESIYMCYIFDDDDDDDDGYTFTLKQPIHDNKEEVAFGLCLLSDGQLTNLNNIIQANTNTTSKTKTMREMRKVKNGKDSVTDVKAEQTIEPAKQNFNLPSENDVKEVFDIVMVMSEDNSDQQDSESSKNPGMLQNIEKDFSNKYKRLKSEVRNKVSGTETDEFFFKNVSTALMLYAMIDEELGE